MQFLLKTILNSRDDFTLNEIVGRYLPNASDESTLEIECGTARTYSRLMIARSLLSESVLRASKEGPWPFGPPGLYFTKACFLRNAVPQMYTRERGAFMDDLSVDVADYSACGPP